VVGLALGAELAHEDTPSKGGRIGIVGVSRPADNRIFSLPAEYTGHSVPRQLDEEEEDIDVEFLLVVSPCYDQMPTSKQTKLFVLLGQKNGLSSMHSIPGSDVFYFSEFRDDSTSSASRQQSWNALVMARAVKQGNNATGDKPKTTINSNQLKLSVSPVDPIAEFLGKLTSLTSTLAVKKDGVLATELQVVAAKARDGKSSVYNIA
jgi:hypothetical protein